MSQVPEIRIRRAHEQSLNAGGDYVLYWMIAFRRPNWNFSLQRAVEWARDLGKPLVVLEALRSDYPWASDRLHTFVVQGMADNRAAFAETPVFYYPYLEPEPHAGRGLLESLARRACVVVSDDFPSFFLPRMVRSAADRIPVRFELVDANGMLPLRAADRVFARAFDFRRFLQKQLPDHLDQTPHEEPLRGVRLPKLPGLPREFEQRWPAARPERLLERPELLAEFPIDHQVRPVDTPGGWKAAERRLATFLEQRLARYEEARNQPEQPVTSGLSPYLHFGHISVHQVFSAVMQHDGWTSDRIAAKPNGSNHGWWNASSEVESFLDELITWREVGYNFCWQRDDYDRYDSLPDWARRTLAEHADDPREHCYDLEEFETARTHDPLWNAAQRQLVREGTIHNYLRMLWGKKILHWSASPRDALEIMIELNNKYALDGRNPNSYSGIFWTLGRYDRAWGPERPIFGKIRYMSSDNTARKVNVRAYLQQYGPGRGQQGTLEFSDP